MKHCKWCYTELEGPRLLVAYYVFDATKSPMTNDPPSGEYCPGCARRFKLKERSVRVPNPEFLKQVE